MSKWSRFDPLPPDASRNVEISFDSPWLGFFHTAGGQSLETGLEARSICSVALSIRSDKNIVETLPSPARNTAFGSRDLSKQGTLHDLYLGS